MASPRHAFGNRGAKEMSAPPFGTGLVSDVALLLEDPESMERAVVYAIGRFNSRITSFAVVPSFRFQRTCITSHSTR